MLEMQFPQFKSGRLRRPNLPESDTTYLAYMQDMSFASEFMGLRIILSDKIPEMYSSIPLELSNFNLSGTKLYKNAYLAVSAKRADRQWLVVATSNGNIQDNKYSSKDITCSNGKNIYRSPASFDNGCQSAFAVSGPCHIYYAYYDDIGKLWNMAGMFDGVSWRLEGYPQDREAQYDENGRLDVKIDW
jgi:hypothetical protein